MGAFASIAQNAYGMDMLGIVAFSFFSIFVIRLITSLLSRKRDLIFPLEWAALAILSLVLGLRIYYIWFEGVEVLFGISGLAIIGIYLVKLKKSYGSFRADNIILGRIILAFYLSIICYMISMTITPFLPLLGEPFGALGFLFIVVFIIGNFRFGEFSIRDERTTALQIIGRFKDGSVIMVIMFVIFTAYMGLTKFDLLPTLYSNQYPKAYYELVRSAESGLEKPVEGQFRHEMYKEQYESLISRNGASKSE